jgi:hypothetical protein
MLQTCWCEALDDCRRALSWLRMEKPFSGVRNGRNEKRWLAREEMQAAATRDLVLTVIRATNDEVEYLLRTCDKESQWFAYRLSMMAWELGRILWRSSMEVPQEQALAVLLELAEIALSDNRLDLTFLGVDLQ